MTLEVVNPFTNDMFYSFDCFRYENIFFDCSKKQIMDDESFMENLQYSFYTYMVTDENHKWIGYALFHSEDMLNDYIEKINGNALNLIKKLAWNHLGNQELLRKLSGRILNSEFISTKKLAELDTLIIQVTEPFLKEREDYLAKNHKLLNDYQENFKIDLVLALPLTTFKDNNFISQNYQTSIKQLHYLVQEKVNPLDLVVEYQSESLTTKTKAKTFAPLNVA